MPSRSGIVDEGLAIAAKVTGTFMLGCARIAQASLHIANQTLIASALKTWIVRSTLLSA